MKVNAVVVWILIILMQLACGRNMAVDPVSGQTNSRVDVSEKQSMNSTKPIDETKRISFKGVSFHYSQNLSKTVRAADVPSTAPADVSSRPDGVESRHVSFSFVEFPRHEKPTFSAELKVYNAEEYLAVFSNVNEYHQMVEKKIRNLRSLISERPRKISPGEYPFVPFLDAVQILQARPTYIEFKNGRGIAYITQFRHSDPILVNNQDIVLVFQGLTSNGKKLISGTFPISASFLPDRPYGLEHNGYKVPDNFYEQREANEIEYSNYVRSIELLLDSASNDVFSPNLEDLKQLFASLEVGID